MAHFLKKHKKVFDPRLSYKMYQIIITVLCSCMPCTVLGKLQLVLLFLLLKRWKSCNKSQFCLQRTDPFVPLSTNFSRVIILNKESIN